MKLENKSTVYSTPIFQVEELAVRSQKGNLLNPRYRINCQDWANILPITADGRALLIRQTRFGNMENVLETPGGVIDLSDKDPMLAALRELEEETGYTSKRVLPLGSFNPNPAIMTNKIHFFLALECYPEPNRKNFQDFDEEIEIEFVSIEELDFLVRTSRINHALSALCIQLSMKYIPNHRS